MSQVRLISHVMSFAFASASVVLQLVVGLPWLYWRCDAFHCSWLVMNVIVILALAVVTSLLLLPLIRTRRAAIAGVLAGAVFISGEALRDYPALEQWGRANLVYPMIPAIFVAALLVVAALHWLPPRLTREDKG